MTRSRKKKSNEEPPAPERSPEVAKALFAEVMEGSVNKSVNPHQCIVLTNIRKPVRSGIDRIKSLFRGRVSSGDVDRSESTSAEVGIVAGSDSPIVIPLTGLYKRYVVDHFKKEGLCEAEARMKAETQSIWYGVVDGMHRLIAIIELIDEDPNRWAGFSWTVTILKGGHDFQKLKQLARHQNFKHSAKHYIETTFYDTICGLRAEAERLRVTNGNKLPTAKQIASAFDGCAHKKESTIKQTATTALRLSQDSVDAIGEITNEEHPELVPHREGLSIRDKRDKKISELIGSVDCRVFRHFIHISSLKSATRFMNAGEEGKDGTQSQINTLFRVREHCRLHRFKSVSHKIVVEQFEKATSSLREVRKFEALIESETWPETMVTMRNNLLRSTRLDVEVTVNRGNEHTVLPSLLEMYRRVCPDTASFKESKYEASHQLEPEPTEANEEDNDETAKSKTPGDDEPETENGNITNHGEAQGRELPVIERNMSKSGDEQPKTPRDGEEFPKSSDNIPLTEKDSDVPGNDSTITEPQESKDGKEPGTISMASERLETCNSRNRNGSRDGISNTNPDYLKKLDIECHQMKWQLYHKTILADSGAIFDMVLTDPPYGTPHCRSGAGSEYDNFVDKEEMKEMAQLCRRVVRPGGWVLLFTSLQYFMDWRTAFNDAEFFAPCYSFVVMKDTTTIQSNRSVSNPQNACEHIMFARAPGERTDGFRTDRSSPYHAIRSKEKRRFAAISGVPVTPQKLLRPGTKSPVLVEEKNPNLLAELMTTFCPEGGSVLDVYAGTFSTAVACIMTERRCVCVEADAGRYRLAYDRIRLIADTKCKASQGEGVLPGKKAKIAVDLKSTEGQRQLSTPRLCNRVSAPSQTTGDSITQVGASDQDQGVSSTRRANEEGICSTEKDVGTDTESVELDRLIKASKKGITSGDTVELTIDGERVGTAAVQYSADPDRLPTTLHSHALNTQSTMKRGQVLVSVFRISIKDDKKSLKYPYVYKGQEPPPATLKGLESGFHAWDLAEMHKPR